MRIVNPKWVSVKPLKSVIFTTKQIVEEYEAQTGIKLDKRKVELPSEIVSVGIYQATVNLCKYVAASIEINVLEK